MPLITKLKGRIVFNSRGNQTVEVDVITDNRYLGRACAPSGASVGKHEAQSFPSNDPNRAIEIFQSNADKFIGAEASDPKAVFEIIKSIDATPSYTILGGSIAYAVSIASVDSASKALDIPLIRVLRKEKPYKNPFPLGNILGGGAHAGPGTPDIQEILVCPLGASDVLQALDMNFKVHGELRRVLERADKSFTYGRGDEGAWAPRTNNEKALELAEQAIKNLGFKIGGDVGLGIDFASSSLWNSDKSCYEYKREELSRRADEQIEYVNSLIQKYDLTYVEDPVHEEDFLGMAEITKKNRKCLVTGDDMLVTNKKRVMEASKYDACSGAILKVNQAGTLYDALLFAKECDRKGLKLVTSHRSGEAVDSHISHIAIATQSKMLKSGIIGGERVAKLNELVRLAEYDLIDGMADLFF
ncbi:MAG TPA: enolase C-terminal domain-like protein [Nitrososphaeraceae archaeon]|nr:enolase C-terminal domain-like protein [Nitrososphaeraceae archaeon]